MKNDTKNKITYLSTYVKKTSDGLYAAIGVTKKGKTLLGQVQESENECKKIIKLVTGKEPIAKKS